MPDVRHLLGSDYQAPGQAQITYARVSSRQPAPSDFTDPLFVVIPDFDPDTAFKIPGNQWPKIHGATLPSLGADVELLIDNRNNKRVVWWEGNYS